MNQAQTEPSTSPSSPPPPPPPPTSVPVYNPLALKEGPIRASSVGISSSLVPSSVKRRAAAAAAAAPKVTPNNPLASSLNLVEPKEAEEEEFVSVPGPKLRFSLVPYPESEDQEDEPVPPPSEEDSALSQFLQKVANM